MNEIVKKLWDIRRLVDDSLKYLDATAPTLPSEETSSAPLWQEVAGRKSLWCPFAIKTDVQIKTQGKYRKGFPEGAIIHYNSGRFLDGDKHALACVKYLAKDEPAKGKYPYPCIVISTTGNIFQPFPLDEWGYHTGTVDHKTSVGIEILSAGKVKPDGEKYISWFGERYESDMVRYCDGSDDRNKGYYVKATPEQEESLIHLLLWMKRNYPDVFSLDNIKGHSHVKDTKDDVGGVLSTSLSDLRAALKSKYTL